MFAFGVVKHIDVFEYVLSCFISGLVDSAPDAFALKQVEEALGNGYRRSFASRLVVTVAASAHRVFEIVLLQKRGPIDAGELET